MKKKTDKLVIAFLILMIIAIVSKPFIIDPTWILGSFDCWQDDEGWWCSLSCSGTGDFTCYGSVTDNCLPPGFVWHNGNCKMQACVLPLVDYGVTQGSGSAVPLCSPDNAYLLTGECPPYQTCSVYALWGEGIATTTIPSTVTTTIPGTGTTSVPYTNGEEEFPVMAFALLGGLGIIIIKGRKWLR